MLISDIDQRIYHLISGSNIVTLLEKGVKHACNIVIKQLGNKGFAETQRE